MTSNYYCTRCRKVHPRFHQASPYRQTWQQMAWEAAKDAAVVIFDVALLLTFFIGIPWVAYLVLTP